MQESDNSLLTIIMAVLGAVGIKEIWTIWKSKLAISAKLKKDERISQSDRITQLETKIESLYIENAELKAKVARLEERILLTAKNRVKSKET